MNLTQTQRNTLNEVTQLINDKYEELIWNECYYDGDNQQIKDILGSLQSEGVEVTFSVNLKTYDVETGEDIEWYLVEKGQCYDCPFLFDRLTVIW